MMLREERGHYTQKMSDPDSFNTIFVGVSGPILRSENSDRAIYHDALQVQTVNPVPPLLEPHLSTCVEQIQ